MQFGSPAVTSRAPLNRVPFAPKRRWFQWSLRTLFVVVTLFGCWLGYEWNWIRQRHALVTRQQALAADAALEAGPKSGSAWTLSFTTASTVARAPGLLWIFGEEPLSDLEVIFIDDGQRDLTVQQHREIEQAKRLFPEADVTWRKARITGK
jgi:hypothetical protein